MFQSKFGVEVEFCVDFHRQSIKMYKEARNQTNNIEQILLNYMKEGDLFDGFSPKKKEKFLSVVQKSDKTKTLIAA